VHVLVLDWFGKYQIRVYNGAWTSPDPYQTQSIDIGDVQWTEVNMTHSDNYFVARALLLSSGLAGTLLLTLSWMPETSDVRYHII
jgi:hypothetical protein